jgi:dihydrofolate reductase
MDANDSPLQSQQRLSLIVAMTRAGVIGRAGGLPWKLSEDLKRFKSLTMGHHLLMGRKTYDSLGRALPGRTSIVITRQASLAVPAGVLIAADFSAARELAPADSEPFVIGGAEIFSLALPHTQRLYVTWVEADVPGDTYFPAFDRTQWREASSQSHSADARNEYDTTFCIYDRVTP